MERLDALYLRIGHCSLTGTARLARSQKWSHKLCASFKNVFLDLTFPFRRKVMQLLQFTNFSALLHQGVSKPQPSIRKQGKIEYFRIFSLRCPLKCLF
jgi:hypothetical protein